MKRVMFARFLPVDYEQTLYSLYQNCRQYSRTVSEYAEEFMRLASRNQLSESDAQQVARFNNGLRYDIQAIICLQTTWTLDEANEEVSSRPKIALDEEEDDEHEAYCSPLLKKVKTPKDTTSFEHDVGSIKTSSTLSMMVEVVRISSHEISLVDSS
ncbi:RNA-directed DNA polymerase [Tanacetum coccineum]